MLNDPGLEDIAGRSCLPALHGGRVTGGGRWGGGPLREPPRFLGLDWLGLLAAVTLEIPGGGSPGGPGGRWPVGQGRPNSSPVALNSRVWRPLLGPFPSREESSQQNDASFDVSVTGAGPAPKRSASPGPGRGSREPPSRAACRGSFCPGGPGTLPP